MQWNDYSVDNGGDFDNEFILSQMQDVGEFVHGREPERPKKLNKLQSC